MSTTAAVTERWRRERIAAGVYDAGVENETVARVAGLAMWGADTRRLFADIARLGELETGAAVLDVPCGGGLAFRGLRPDREFRYVAADVSPYMLERAREQAARRGLEAAIELREADITAMGFADGEFDLCVSYNSLHCLPDVPAALAEIVRVLAPGGELRGTSVVRGNGIRQDGLIRLFRAGGMFALPPRERELAGWLSDLGLEDVRVDTSGALAFFSGRKP